MLFGNESISTYSKANVTIWMILAFQGGLINIGGLLACHSFVSHVTGFATLFGREVYFSNYLEAAGILAVPFFFLVGAMLSGFLVDLRLKQGRKPAYFIAFGALFVFLLAVVIGGFNGYFGRFGEPLEVREDYTLLAILCMICGIQNGLVTQVSKSVVRTTHLTGITTDLGIGLVRVLGKHSRDETRANFMRVGIIFCFALGSLGGVALFTKFAYRGFLFPTAIYGTLFFTTLYYQVLRPRAKGGG
jgi:uncharacterized membrane protein YoaK (UPF0700 family)